MEVWGVFSRVVFAVQGTQNGRDTNASATPPPANQHNSRKNTSSHICTQALGRLLMCVLACVSSPQIRRVRVRTKYVNPCSPWMYFIHAMMIVLYVRQTLQPPNPRLLPDFAMNTKAGYYCPPGESASPSLDATLVACGNPTVFCPEGSVEPVPVRAGFYSVGGGSEGTTRVSQVSLGHIPGRGVLHFRRPFASKCGAEGTLSWWGGGSVPRHMYDCRARDLSRSV